MMETSKYHQSYFRRTLQELADIKEAMDQVLVVSITDPAGVITYVNDKFCELYQYSREEVIGKTHSMFKSGEHSKEFYQKLWNTIESGKIFSGEIKNKAKDGTLYWSYLVIFPFLDEKNRPYQYVSFRTDITAVKEAEQEKGRLLRAEMAIEAKDQFVSMAVHELKTPLTSIQLVLDLLCEVAGPDRDLDQKKIQHLLNTALYQANRLNSIIDDLLDVSRIESGKLAIDREKVDLGGFFDRLLKHLREDFEASGCKVSFRLKEPVVGFWEEGRLEQVIINLLTNAMKYGGKKPIEIEVGKDGNEAIIQVRDHGVGMSSEFQKRIFGKFERENPSRFGGNGLGLWISHQIIDAHGGRIEIQSQKGEGSTFTVRLPLGIA